jgi:type I restriction-modification system DNA methylase subunit
VARVETSGRRVLRENRGRVLDLIQHDETPSNFDQIVGPLKDANKLFDIPDFDDDSKLGSGKEKVERLTNLVAIFENPALDLSKNRADGDGILGDAYEYLMHHFATESGKSNGQFYTPAEVSRVIAQVIGIRRSKPTAQTTVYDPTLVRGRCSRRSRTRRGAGDALRAGEGLGHERARADEPDPARLRHGGGIATR